MTMVQFLFVIVDGCIAVFGGIPAFITIAKSSGGRDDEGMHRGLGQLGVTALLIGLTVPLCNYLDGKVTQSSQATITGAKDVCTINMTNDVPALNVNEVIVNGTTYTVE